MFNFLKRKPKENTLVTPCQVLIINDPNGYMHHTLGISDNRFNELSDSIGKLSNKGLKMSEIIAEASKFCKHPNELAYVCYTLGYQANVIHALPATLINRK